MIDNLTFKNVGVKFFNTLQYANVYLSLFLIGIITFLFSILGVYIGQKGGDKYETKAELLGGIVLILIGFKILLF